MSLLNSCCACDVDLKVLCVCGGFAAFDRRLRNVIPPSVVLQKCAHQRQEINELSISKDL